MQNKQKPLPHGFSKGQRLLKPAEYQKVFTQQKKCYNRGVLAYYCANEGLGARLGLVVAKRHFKKAVTRNQIKRRIRESFRLQSGLGNVDVIILATAKLGEEQLCQMPSIMSELWQQLMQQK